MATIQQLLARKSKADSLDNIERAKYVSAYNDLLDQILEQLIQLSYECDGFYRALEEDCRTNKDNSTLTIDRLTAPAQRIAAIFGVKM